MGENMKKSRKKIKYYGAAVVLFAGRFHANGCLQCGPAAFGGVGVAVPWLLANVCRVRYSSCDPSVWYMVYCTRSRYGLHVANRTLA